MILDIITYEKPKQLFSQLSVFFKNAKDSIRIMLTYFDQQLIFHTFNNEIALPKLNLELTVSIPAFFQIAHVPNHPFTLSTIPDSKDLLKMSKQLKKNIDKFQIEISNQDGQYYMITTFFQKDNTYQEAHMINYESDNENFKIESLEPNLDNIDCVARFNTNLFLMILKFADKSEQQLSLIINEKQNLLQIYTDNPNMLVEIPIQFCQIKKKVQKYIFSEQSIKTYLRLLGKEECNIYIRIPYIYIMEKQNNEHGGQILKLVVESTPLISEYEDIVGNIDSMKQT